MQPFTPQNKEGIARRRRAKCSTHSQHHGLWNLQQDGLVRGDDVPVHVKVALHGLP